MILIGLLGQVIQFGKRTEWNSSVVHSNLNLEVYVINNLQFTVKSRPFRIETSLNGQEKLWKLLEIPKNLFYNVKKRLITSSSSNNEWF